MKKIVLALCLLVLTLSIGAQSICTQTFSVSGQDDDPTVLTINSTDLTCNGSDPITAIRLINPQGALASSNCSTDGSGWYGFQLIIDGVGPILRCGPDLDNIDITGFTNLTITSQDDDNFSDGITITIDVEVTYTPLNPPNCDSSLTSATTDFPIDGTLTWSAATGDPTGYKISVGTTMGGTDIANNVDVGNTTSYTPTGLSYSTLYYTTITPYNANGDATGCTEESFTVEAVPPPGADCNNALALTPGTPQAGDSVGQSGTFNDGGGAIANPCSGNYNDDEYWFEYTAVATGETLDLSVTDITQNWAGVFVLEGPCTGPFTCVANDTNGSSTADLTITTPILTGGTTYYIVIANWGTPDNTAFTLNSTVIPPPTCDVVTDVTIDTFTDSEVTVNWTPSTTGETDWEVIVQTTPTADPGPSDSGIAVNATVDSAPPFTVGGLSEQTAYEVFVRANCGGGDFGDWVAGGTFTTPCAAIVPEYNADMSTHVPDSCWDEAGAGDPGTGPTSLGFSDWRGGTSYAFGSSNAINIFGTSIREWLLSPTFDMSGDDYQLEINVAVTDWQSSTADDTMGADDEVQLLITTDGGTTWTNLTTWNEGNEPLPTGTEYVEDLTAYTGTVQFALWANSGTSSGQDYDFHVGKFRVVAIPSSATVDYCNLQFPNSGTINEGDNFTAFAQVLVNGVTEAAGQGADVEAWIGYSTTDATTVADFESPSWTWVPATYNTDNGNNDEYQAEIGSALAGGSYFYASRFRYDGGVFAYGGITPGGSSGNFWDGTNFVSGQLDVLPTPPTVAATFNINGCGASDSFSTAYDGNVQNVYWVQLIYDGNCVELTTDTETTVGIDTEIGLYDVFGNLLGSNDDGGTGTLSTLTEQGLAAGTYYIAAGGFNTTFGANFAVTSNNTSTGTLVINASTPNVPDFVNLQFPGTATITSGQSEDVFAQIFEAGVTEGAGAGAGITAEIGISAVDATTTADFETGDWTWTAANHNAAVTGNNDEYSLAIGASLAPGTYYYVSRFSIDGGPFVYGGFSGVNPGPSGGSFWDGTTNVSGVLTVNPKPEPTNHVTDFTAVADSDTEITLTWTDNDGAQAADGFLIVGRTGATAFYVPVDGTDDANDTDWSDDEAEVKVAFGVQTYTFTGLTASTLYDFEIYPYTNSGANIDYKTDGTVPTASATTDADPCSIAIGTFPYLESFENGGIIPNCWTSTSSTARVWDFATSPTFGNSFSDNTTGTGFFAFVDASTTTTTTDATLTSPLIYVSGITTPVLEFYQHHFVAGGTNSNTLSVEVFDGTSWNLLYTDNNGDVNGWEKITIDLSTLTITGDIQVRFIIDTATNSNFENDIAIDDVAIFEAPICTAAVVASSTIQEDCENGQYTIDVEITNIGDGIFINDGSNTYPVVNGVVTVGPYPDNTSVTLEFEHSDPACDFTIGTFSFACQDACATAPSVVAGTYTTTINTGNNSADMTLPGGVNAAWFAFTAPSDGVIDVSACGSGIDTDLAVGTGTCGSFANVVATDDTLGCPNFSSEVTNYPVSSGQIYYIEWSDEWDEGPFEWTLTFTPNPVTYTFNGTWSPEDPNGVATANDDIVIASGDAVISSDLTVNTVTVNPGAGLTVNTGFTLTVNDPTIGLTLESIQTSYSSLILDGTVTGTMNYERHVNINGSGTTGDNDLISAPLTGQQFNNFATANPNIFSNTGATLYLFGPFDKTTGAYVTYANTETATLDPGVGYRAASDDNSSFTFTGTANSGTVTAAVAVSGPAFQEWNLIGNPYPSYLNIRDFLNDATNQTLLGGGPNLAIYGYDGDATNGWDVRNLSNSVPADVMAPGQGFFVAAQSAGNIQFTNSMRRTGNSDDFIAGRNAQLTYLKLGLTSSTNGYITDFYFNDASSLGLDVGYDAGLWGGTAPGFAIYSDLVQGSTGVPLAIQSLNTTDLTDVTIPLGVNSANGVQVTFSITDTTLPATVEVYLDDTVEGTVTLLTSGDYVLTPSTDLSGTGRFFLRFVDSALSVGDDALNALSIYVDNNTRDIVVQGQLNAETEASVYDIQGRLVAQQSLDTATLQHRIDGSRLANGVYIVSLDDGITQRTQKVILR
jgi:hypothetical protein